MQPQGQVQVLVNLLDRRMDLQQALDAPRVRALNGRRISAEQRRDANFAGKLVAFGHQVIAGEEIPADWLLPHDFVQCFVASAQVVSIDGEALCGASDPRLDGIATPW